MRALCSSADGVLGQKQQSERKHGARRKTPEKRGDVRLKAVEGPDGKDSQKCYRLATYLIVLGLHLVNHFRTSSRKICVPPCVSKVYVTLNYVSSYAFTTTWPARAWRFFGERTSVLEGDGEFRSLRICSAIPVGPAQRKRCKSLRFPIEFRVSNAA